jgi:hypothetical protein
VAVDVYFVVVGIVLAAAVLVVEGTTTTVDSLDDIASVDTLHDLQCAIVVVGDQRIHSFGSDCCIRQLLWMAEVVGGQLVALEEEEEGPVVTVALSALIEDSYQQQQVVGEA